MTLLESVPKQPFLIQVNEVSLEQLHKTKSLHDSQYLLENSENELERNAHPTSSIIDDLKVFEENLNEEINTHAVPDQLNKLRTPAIVFPIDGRYFGFVKRPLLLQ